MRKLFAILIILSTLLPLFASAKEVKDHADDGINQEHHPLLDKKRDLLESAKAARESANTHLDKAYNLLNDLKTVKSYRIKERLQILIGSCITSTFITDPRTKVLTVALSLIADIVIKEGFERCEIIYDFYMEMVSATACLETCQYYYRLSIDTLDIDYGINNDWKYANWAIDSLTIADMLTIALEQRTFLWNKGIGDALSSYINQIKNNLIFEMLLNRRIVSNYSSDLEGLLENFCEIVAEVPRRDRPLVEKIRNRLNNAYKYLVIAERG